MTKKTILGVLAGLSLSALSSHGSVILTVEESGTGVTMTASGSINTSSLSWNSDDSSPVTQLEVGLAAIRVIVPNDYEWFNVSGSTYTPALAGISYDSIDLGSNGLGLFAAGGVFYLVGSGAIANDNTAPVQTSWDFDFVLTDVDGSLSQYTDGHVLWDSNGATAGGEQISFSVVNVPEPSSVALLGLGALGVMIRRNRQA